MKVVLLKDKKFSEELSIPKGKVFNVRLISNQNLLGGTNRYYQIIDIESAFSGEKLLVEDCIEQKELPNKALIEQKERAQQLVIELTESMKKKNAEINSLEYCVNVLAGSLHTMTDAFHKLKALEKFQNR